jgi:XTP/dITP diphosphohydrolase
MIVVEDSGLFINALKGFPGPFSAYAHVTLGIRGLLQLMRQEKRREAHFEACLATASPRDSGRIFSGKVRGTIAREPIGKDGFGFDPIFIPKGTRTTFAQGGDEFKNRFSHRARAFRKLAVWLVKKKGLEMR